MDELEELRGLARAVEELEEKMGAGVWRVYLTARNKHSEEEHEVPFVFDLISLSFQLSAAIRGADRWQAIVDTGRAIRGQD